MVKTEQVFDEIRAERSHQENKWGTSFDDKNTLNDWIAYMIRYLGHAQENHATVQDMRKGILKATTLGVAALEALDRNGSFSGRHYD